MNQRSLVIGLGLLLALGLVAGLLLVGDGFDGWLSGNDAGANAVAADDDTEICGDNTWRPGDSGRDHHGKFSIGESGKRVYRDPGGRDYTRDATGNRIYRDSKGREYIDGPDGKRIYREAGKRGRFYRVNRDGSRTEVDSGGNPLGGGADNSGSPDGDNGGGDVTDNGTGDESATATLSGSVVDTEGAAYEGAKVSASADGRSFETETDLQGQFQLSGLPVQTTVTVVASDAAGQKSKAVKTRLAKGAAQLGEPLVLARSSIIAGIVRSADNGLLLAGVRVQLQEQNPERGWQFTTRSEVQTSISGSFTFDDLEPKSYRIYLTKQDHAPRILNSVKPPANLQVTLQPGATISGRVLDVEDKPILQARITCDFHAEPAQDFRTEAFTDVQGVFAVICQPESQHNTLTVNAPGYVSQKKTLIKSGSIDIEFKLMRSANVVLRGRIVNSSGQPVTMATFRAFDSTGRYAPILQFVNPNENGAFWVEVRKDAVELRITGPTNAQVSVPYSPVEYGEVDLGEIILDSGYTVFGIVHEVGDVKAVIQNATVNVGGVAAITGEDGAYRIEGLSGQEFIISARHPAYLGTAVTHTPASGQYEIELNLELRTAGFEARVQVIDGDTASPLPEVVCTVIQYAKVLVTDEQGQILITGLSSLKPTVRFEKEGYVTRTLEITADVSEVVKEAPPQVIELVRGNSITGLCTGKGKPLQGGTVVEVWNEKIKVVTTATDSAGRYDTGNLEPGVYFIGLPGHHYAPRKVVVPVEGGAVLDLEIGAVIHLRGKIKRSDGSAHANAGVYLYRKGELYWMATFYTGPDGSYEVRNLWPGEFVFCALKTQGDASAQYAVTVNAQGEGWQDVDVQLPQATGVVEGRVTFPDGRPVVGARVAITNLSAGFERALLAAYVVTDSEGKYRAERMENGAQMIARVGGYQDQARTGTAFSDVFYVGANESPVEADIEVPSSGVSVIATVTRADGGPMDGSGFLCYLFDSQGRMSGLYFGSGSPYKGTVRLYDVVPGNYRLVVTHKGMKKAEAQIVVGQTGVKGLKLQMFPDPR